jgi:hypothetical protein
MCVCSEPIVTAAVLPSDNNVSILNRLDKRQCTVDRMFALLPGNLCTDSVHMHTNNVCVVRFTSTHYAVNTKCRNAHVCLF